MYKYGLTQNVHNNGTYIAMTHSLNSKRKKLPRECTFQLHLSDAAVKLNLIRGDHHAKSDRT